MVHLETLRSLFFVFTHTHTHVYTHIQNDDHHQHLALKKIGNEKSCLRGYPPRYHHD